MYTNTLGAIFPVTIDHIPAQNKAGDDLGSVVNRFTAARDTNTLTAELRAQLAAEALAIGQNFYNYAYNTVKTDRARTGGDYILNLARQISGDISNTAVSQGALVAPAQTEPATTGYPTVDQGGADTLPGALIIGQAPAPPGAAPGSSFAPAAPGSWTDPFPAEAPGAALMPAGGGLMEYAPYIAGGLVLAYLLSGRRG